jgi:hypothetical protein
MESGHHLFSFLALPPDVVNVLFPHKQLIKKMTIFEKDGRIFSVNTGGLIGNQLDMVTGFTHLIIITGFTYL